MPTSPIHLLTSSSLAATLAGFENKVREAAGLTAFVASIANNPKRAVEIQNGGKPSNLPYGFYTPSSIDINNERGNPTSIARIGSSGPQPDGSTSTIKVAHFMPVTLSGVEATFRYQDFQTALDSATRLLYASSTKQLQFELRIGADGWTVEVNLGGNQGSVPWPKMDDLDNPNGQYFEFQLSFTVATKIGMMRDVAKFNNNGRITLNMEVS